VAPDHGVREADRVVVANLGGADRGRQLLSAVANSLARVGVLLSALADEGGDQVEHRVADPALDVDHPSAGTEIRATPSVALAWAVSGLPSERRGCRSDR
jgi:hypothetical protein